MVLLGTAHIEQLHEWHRALILAAHWAFPVFLRSVSSASRTALTSVRMYPPGAIAGRSTRCV